MSKPNQEKELRCPLCLKKLGSNDELIALKLGIEEEAEMDHITKTFNCGKSDLLDDLLEFGGENLVFIDDTDNIVCLSHLNCGAKGLFYDSEKQRIDTDKFTTGITTLKDFGRTGDPVKKEISHWIIRMLSKTGRKMEDHNGMWFPYPLFRAVGKSSLVELVGSQGVGKTVLTLQLTNKKNFLGNLRKQNMELTDYVYIHDNESYWAELALRTEWEKHYPISRPLATNKNTPGDIRAIFIEHSSPLSDDKSSSEPSTITTSQSVFLKRKTVNSLYSKVRWLLTALKIAVRNPDEESTSKNGEGKTQTPTYPNLNFDLDKLNHLYSIIFYDTAGEAQQGYEDVTEQVRKHTDKLVICIDAEELFDETYTKKPHTSIILALERIKRLTGINKKRACLLITKLDTVLSREELERIKQIVEQRPTEKQDVEIDGEIRSIILERLKDTNDSDKQDLISKIENDRYIERLFFVWTQGLPKMGWLQKSPIEKFEPESGKISDQITITLKSEHTSGSNISRVAFGGINAKEFIKEDNTLKVIVPDDARTGLIEIDILNAQNEFVEASSEKVFVVGGCNSDGKPQSFGVLRFLSWCLDKDLDEIVNFKR